MTSPGVVDTRTNSGRTSACRLCRRATACAHPGHAICRGAEAEESSVTTRTLPPRTDEDVAAR